MKISIASDGKNVSGHFGHCEGFNIYNIKENKIIDKDFIKNPGHKPGFLPKFLAEKKVNVIIAGGMGGHAQQLFNENNIEVIVGAVGDCDQIIEKYVNKQLASTNSVCNAHDHSGECEEH